MNWKNLLVHETLGRLHSWLRYINMIWNGKGRGKISIHPIFATSQNDLCDPVASSPGP